MQAGPRAGLDNPDYNAARAHSNQMAGPEGIDRMLAANNVVALRPTDIVALQQRREGTRSGGAGRLPAVAGYPHLTVPMGVERLPVGLPWWPRVDDARILALGYAYEQAAKIAVTPGFLSSIEDAPDVAKHLRPAR